MRGQACPRCNGTTYVVTEAIGPKFNLCVCGEWWKVGSTRKYTGSENDLLRSALSTLLAYAQRGEPVPKTCREIAEAALEGRER